MAERSPAAAGVVAWGSSGAIFGCGLSDPVALAEWLRPHGDVPGRSLVLLCRREEAQAGRLLANVTAGALPRTHVSLVLHDVTAQGIALAAETALAQGLGDGALLEAVSCIAEQLRCGVHLASVTGLSRPRPSFGQHVRSLLPLRPRFVAWTGAQPSVVALDRQRPVVGVDGGTCCVQHDDPRAPGFADAAGQREVPALVDVAAHYGARGGEFTLLPLRITLPAVSHRCPTCHSELATGCCPSCHVVAHRKDEVQ